MRNILNVLLIIGGINIFSNWVLIPTMYKLLGENVEYNRRISRVENLKILRSLRFKKRKDLKKYANFIDIIAKILLEDFKKKGNISNAKQLKIILNSLENAITQKNQFLVKLNIKRFETFMNEVGINNVVSNTNDINQHV